MKALPVAAAVMLNALASLAQAPPLAEQVRGLLKADGLKADVSFLASDLLEGRGTPSRGLDLAAEYIAAQFRRAGLEPIGDDGYFQTASFTSLTPSTEPVELILDAAGSPVKAVVGSLTPLNAYPDAIDVNRAPVIKVAMDDAGAMAALTPDKVVGKVIVLKPGRGPSASVPPGIKPAAAILLMTENPPGMPSTIVRDPSVPAPPFPSFICTDAAFGAALDTAGSSSVSLRARTPKVETVKLRNVAGLLRGSDPNLKDTYVLVTAHYDHIGIGGNNASDRINNGANDDASGTASVIEIANALSLLPHPKRSIVFMAFFGEENRFIGSRYYTEHPIFPLAETILDFNLECLGRTDDSEGPRVGEITMVGYDYTDLPPVFARAAAQTGVKTTKHPINNNAFFDRADSFAFAHAGVPAATAGVAYEYPDYHQPGDEWQKLDYDNMAKVDQTIALELLDIANNAQAPKGDKMNPRTAQFVKERAATMAAAKR